MLNKTHRQHQSEKYMFAHSTIIGVATKQKLKISFLIQQYIHPLTKYTYHWGLQSTLPVPVAIGVLLSFIR
jgi:hypothetical protein